MGDFYTHSGYPSTGAAGLSASARAEFQLIQSAFDKLPSLSGNANKVVVINGGATGLTVTSAQLVLSGSFTKGGSDSLTLTTTAPTTLTLPISGTLATLAGVETLTNKTLTSPTLTSPTLTSPALASPTFSGTYTIGAAGTILVTPTTGHGIGSTPAAGTGMIISLQPTGVGSSNARAILFTTTVTAGISDNIQGWQFSTNIVKPGSGTNVSVDGVLISVPTISGSASATNASTLNIAGAPASGATNLYALRVQSGTSLLGGLVDLVGGQIKFPASQNASADVNTLDDYEEGTWTPSLGGTATYIARSGSYTKIGRQVTVDGVIQVNAIGTGSQNTISGLPFTVANTTPPSIGAAIIDSAAINLLSTQCQTVPNSTSIQIISMITSAGPSYSLNNIITSGTTINFSVTYRV